MRKFPSLIPFHQCSKQAILDMASHSGQGWDPKFLHVPYEQRWEHLKPTIIRLYMEEKERLAALAQRMKDEYSFSAL
jgi:hypothetical protein